MNGSRDDAAVVARKVHQLQAAITENVALTETVYRVRCACPEIAERAVPGQFVMVRPANCVDPLIGRPLAVYDVLADANGVPSWIDLVYRVGGKGTQHLARLQKGQRLEIWGPLGNGFPVFTNSALIMVAGGIGQTPFLTLGKEVLGRAAYGRPPRAAGGCQRVHLCYGAQAASGLVAVSDFENAGIEVHVATDDGSRGHRGLVTDLLAGLLDRMDEVPAVACCGPEPMLQRVCEVTAQRGVPTWVSLETPMACGVGICYSCVTRVRISEHESDYRRTCVCGPVFEAHEIDWET